MSNHGLPNAQLSAVLSQAASFEAMGRWPQAASAYERAAAIEPRDIRALIGLGALALRRGDHESGTRHFLKALKQRPGDPQMNYNVGLAYLQARRADLGLDYAERAAKGMKGRIDPLRLLFEIHTALGHASRARPFIEAALELAPGDPSLLLALAQNFDTGGQPERAAAMFRATIATGRAPAYAFYGLTQTERFAAEPPEMAEIRARLAAPETAPRDRDLLHRASAKILDDLGRYDEAFAEHIAAGRSQTRVAEERVAFDAQIERMRERFTPDFFAQHRDAGSKSRRPVFVFGMPRSGTTLVEQILASHPHIHGAEELTFFSDRVADLARRPFGQTDIAPMARDYLSILSAHSKTAERVVDKMPHNFERLWLLALLFPNATFIHCRRDPLANCVSCFTQALGRVHFYTADLGTLGRYYRQYEALMQHWHAVLPVRILDVQYEELVANQEGVSRRIVEHTGLPWNDACLRFHEVRRSVRTPSRRQVERPIYTSGLTAWRRYEKHLGPLFEALGLGPDGQATGA